MGYNLVRTKGPISMTMSLYSTAAPVQNILYTARKLASTTSNVSIYIYGCIGAIYHIAKWIYEVSLPSLKRAGDDEAGEEFGYM